MEFNYLMPTKIIIGKGCVINNSSEFSSRGNKALIVTGKKSSKMNGSLNDIIRALNNEKIEYVIFDNVEENPSLETCILGSTVAKKEKVNFLIGCGGGSPLDAAKAIAALVVNRIDPKELFYTNITEMLPIIAVPTTAGTGSEVTPYAIITDHELKQKRNFSNRKCFPEIAFLDASYTMDLPHKITIDTTVDFLSHAVEGIFTKKSSPFTDLIALEAIKIFGLYREELLSDKLTFEIRQQLLYASTLAGIVIAQTGTSVVHALGYPLTIFQGIPHGRANGILMGEFFDFLYNTEKEKIKQILEALRLRNINQFFELMIEFFKNEKVRLNDQEILEYAKSALEKCQATSPKPIALSNLESIYQNSLV